MKFVSLFSGFRKPEKRWFLVLASRPRLLFGAKRRAGWGERVVFYSFFRQLSEAAEKMFFTFVFRATVGESYLFVISVTTWWISSVVMSL